MLDNNFVQFTLLLAAAVLPVAMVLALTQPTSHGRHEGRETATAVASLPTAEVAPDGRAEPKAAAIANPSGNGNAAPGKRPTADVVYRRGTKRLASGDYIGAICDFDDVLRMKPDLVWC